MKFGEGLLQDKKITEKEKRFKNDLILYGLFFFFPFQVKNRE